MRENVKTKGARPWSYALPLEGKLNGEKRIWLEFLLKRSSGGIVLRMVVKKIMV